MFKGDLAKVYNKDYGDFEWAEVVAERQDEKNGVHTKFDDNKNEFIYMSGFMVINSKKWREENKVKQFFDVIKKYSSKLKMFDLDVLNLSCTKINPIDFKYCVLENIYDEKDIKDAPEYPWLSSVYTDKELQNAKDNPIIIHYAGKYVKIWNRKFNAIPNYYWECIENSNFYNEYYFYPISKIKYLIYKILAKITPIKKVRRKIKEKLYNYEQEKFDYLKR